MPDQENISAAAGTGFKGERQLLSMLNSMPAFIAYVDADIIYRYVNFSYTKWLGRPLEEITGKK
jgi:PAS domain-containing protein